MNLYRFYIYVIGLSPFILWAWVNSDPLAALAHIRRLRRWARQKSQEHHGRKSANIILKEFRRAALKKGYPKADIDDFAKRYRPHLIEKEGKRIYVERYGEEDSYDIFG